jgi:opacity protein-like surface antigen
MKFLKTITIILLLFSFKANSQDLLIEGGKSLTAFKFKNSQGENLDNLQGTSQSYFSIAYRKNVVKNILYVIAGTGINTYGAIGSDDSVNNFFEWEATYLNVFVGLDFKVYGTDKMTFYLRGTTSAEFMLQGSQTLNNQVFNIVGAADFDKTNYFFRAGTAIEYKLNNTLSLSFQYRYGQSKQLKNNATEPNQSRLRFKSHDIGLGLVVKL